MDVTPAAFMFVWLPGGLIAAVTRRNNPSRWGLPGGKLEPNEKAKNAAMREAWEEGWVVSRVFDEPFFENEIDGRPIQYFGAMLARKMDRYKEMGQIHQMEITEEQYLQSPYGRKAILNAAQDFKTRSLRYQEILGVKYHETTTESTRADLGGSLGRATESSRCNNLP